MLCWGILLWIIQYKQSFLGFKSLGIEFGCFGSIDIDFWFPDFIHQLFPTSFNEYSNNETGIGRQNLFKIGFQKFREFITEFWNVRFFQKQNILDQFAAEIVSH